MAMIKISFHLNTEAQWLFRSHSCYTTKLLRRVYFLQLLSKFYALIRRTATFKFHRPPRMRVWRLCLMAPVQLGAPFISPIIHCLTKASIQLSYAPHNEMHFKCYAFWSLRHFLSPWSKLLVWRSAAFQHLGFLSVRFSIFIILLCCSNE